MEVGIAGWGADRMHIHNVPGYNLFWGDVSTTKVKLLSVEGTDGVFAVFCYNKYNRVIRRNPLCDV